VNGRTTSCGTGKRRDREMVLDTLRFVAERPASRGQVLNLTDHSACCLEAGHATALHRELQDIRQIGPKVAAFFLRDLVAVLRLQSHLTAEDYVVLQPIDTWVEQVAKRLAIQPAKCGLALSLVGACQECGVDPIRFNQGAWYVGAHSFDILLERLGQTEP